MNRRQFLGLSVSLASIALRERDYRWEPVLDARLPAHGELHWSPIQLDMPPRFGMTEPLWRVLGRCALLKEFSDRDRRMFLR